jgi:hypothetical protein
VDPFGADRCIQNVDKEEKMKRPFVLALLVAGAAVLAGSATGAGPSPGIAFGSPGVLSHDGKVRYVALRAGKGTLVEAVTTQGGEVRQSRFVRGRYGIPLVAYDGSTGGLSRNGKRLVVYLWGPEKTRYVVLDPRTLRVRSRIVLNGNFGFDALSPDGSLMYLIHIKGNGNGPIDYEVRALNVDTGQLYPGAIVDRREPNEKMTGIPMTRVGSEDASWAYTLYNRSSGGAFVHALHTTAREAFCIDVPLKVADEELGNVRMRLTNGTLALRLHGKTVATIDTRTLEVKR